MARDFKFGDLVCVGETPHEPYLCLGLCSHYGTVGDGSLTDVIGLDDRFIDHFDTGRLRRCAHFTPVSVTNGETIEISYKYEIS